jgi:carbon starvation protein
MNNYVNTGVTAAFLILVLLVVLSCARVWWQLLVQGKSIPLREEPPIFAQAS